MPDTNGDVLLDKILQSGMDELEAQINNRNRLPTQAPSTAAVDERKQDKENHSQWALGGNGRFMPVGSTVLQLPAGIYEPFAVPGMWGLEKIEVSSDDIYLLPDMATQTVLDEVHTFWQSEEKYRHHKLLYKRGIILWGPPGGGKTVAIKLLMNELVKQDGIVVIASDIALLLMCMKALRRIEPTRNLIVVFEDIDEILYANGEHGVLAMLDGEDNVDNVLHLATTNHPEKLGARIMNRPSRFDRRILVGMPTAESRRAYLEKKTNGGLSEQDIAQWVVDTDKMSIAHLRELVAAVYCLGQPYADVIERLQGMAKQIKSDDTGFEKNELGFKKSA